MSLCNYDECDKIAYYGFYYEKPIRCKEHKEDHKPQYKICVCGKHTPTYNFKGEKRAKCCKKCKEETMINMTGYKCKCGNGALFNFEGEHKPIYCRYCKEENMIDVTNKKCKCELGCRTYNFKNKPPKYCKTCKKEGMINTRSKRCYCGNAHPIYNHTGKKPEYCKDCKKDDMVNVKHNKCKCGTIACYNYPDQTKGICCVTCKKDNMIDVKNNSCECGKSFLLYNYPNEKKGIRCIDCIKPGMIDVIHRRCKCGNIPTFNYEEEIIPICCNKCKSKTMVNVADRSKRCHTPLCTIAGNPKYRGYCTYCFSHTFPSDPLTLKIYTKSKEIQVRNFINENYNVSGLHCTHGFQHDKTLWMPECDCTHRRRVDHRKLFGNTLLCIETDENQHKQYDKNDEIFRYDDLYMYHSGKFIFIRYNPDSYKNKKGEKCNPDSDTRLIILKKEIDKQIERIKNEENIELLEIHHLYYNNY